MMTTITVPITIGTSPASAAETVEQADPGKREDRLDEERPSEQAERRQAEHDQPGSARVAQHVPEQQLRLRDAPGPQGAHVVLRQRVEHGTSELRCRVRDRTDQQRRTGSVSDQSHPCTLSVSRM